MTIFTVQEYLEAPPLPFPIVHEDKAIRRISGFCSTCSGPLQQYHGFIKPWNQCLEVHAAGICPACALVVTIGLRWYFEDNRVLVRGEHGWKEPDKPILSGRGLLSTIKNLFSR